MQLTVCFLLCLWPAEFEPPMLVRHAVRRLAATCELIRPDSESYYLSGRFEWRADRAYLQERAQKARGLPSLRELERFPTKAEVKQALDFNREHQLFCRRAMCFLAYDEDALLQWQAYLATVERLEEIWHTLLISHYEWVDILCRRKHLRDLKAELEKWQLPWASWEAGVMPPPVPVWAFRHH